MVQVHESGMADTGGFFIAGLYLSHYNHAEQSFIDENIWDEARIFIGKNTFGNGTKAPQIQKKNAIKTYIQNDELIYVRNHD